MYVGANIDDAKRLMFWAESMDRQTIREKDITEWGNRMGIHDANHLSEELYTTLMSWTKGKAMTTVHRCKENGAEAWRQLQVQYNPRTLGNKVTIRNRIMNPKTCVADGKLIETIEEWDEQHCENI